MSDQIISREAIRARGRAAFNAGKPRDSHNMNWHAAALPDWLDGYDRAYAEWAMRGRKDQAEAVAA